MMDKVGLMYTPHGVMIGYVTDIDKDVVVVDQPKIFEIVRGPDGKPMPQLTDALNFTKEDTLNLRKSEISFNGHVFEPMEPIEKAYRAATTKIAVPTQQSIVIPK